MLSKIFSFIVKARNKLFDHNIMNERKLSVPVVAVGNLTVGGTGKTPMVDYLISFYIAQGKKVGVVSRGYGGSYGGSVEVDTSKSFPTRVYGDEPVMLKTKWPDVPIYLCKKRYDAGLELLKKHKVDVIIADDAYQHRALHRDLNILLFDLTSGKKNYQLLPKGRMREPFSGASRADVVIFNKFNMMKSEQEAVEKIDWIKSKLPLSSKGLIFLRGGFKTRGFTNLKNTANSVSDLDEKRVGLISGLGNPKGFELLMLKLGFAVEKHWSYRDHHEFSDTEIREALQSLQGYPLVVTEKDASKIRQLENVDHSLIWSVAIESFLESLADGNIEEFNEKLISLVR